MTEQAVQKPQKEQIGSSILVSESSRNGIVLIIAILFAAIMGGVLGAFKNGEFQKTYDFVQVEMALEEIDYNSEVFSQLTSNSREVITDKILIMYDEELGETYEIEVQWYKGYYKNYFFVSAWFYLETMMNTITVTIFYIALINFLISRKKSKDVVYLKLTGEINDIVIEKNDVPATTFEPYLDDWNGGRKKGQFKSNMRYKISKLERRTKYKVKKVFQEKDEHGKFKFVYEPEFLKKKIKWYKWPFKEARTQRKARKYINKKLTLQSFLTEEYINENVLYEKVKHFRYIYPSFVYNGKNGIHKTTDQYSSITPDDKKKTKDLGKKIMLGLASTSAFAVVLSFTLFRADEDWLIVIYTVVLKLLPLVLQWILGVDYSNTYMQDQLISTQKHRLSIINMYLTNKDKFAELEKPIEIPVKKPELAKDVN